MLLTENEKKALRQRFLDSLTPEYIEGLYRVAVNLHAKCPRFRKDTREMVKILQGSSVE